MPSPPVRVAPRIHRRTQPRPTWPPFRQIRALRRLRRTLISNLRPRLRHTTPSRLRRHRAAATSPPTRLRSIQTAASSRFIPLTIRHRRSPNTTSRRPPVTTICGRQATGRIRRLVIRSQAITGCRACGFRLPMRAHCGRPATGATGITTTGSIAAIGVSTSASMEVSTTDLVTSATATRAVTGVAVTLTTIARSTT